MTLENYISEAVSHGMKHSYIPMLDELDDQTTMDEFIGLLEELKYKYIPVTAELRKMHNRKVYKIRIIPHDPSIRVLVKNSNSKDEEYFRVRFDSVTKVFKYAESICWKAKTLSTKKDIRDLIEYMK